jgi:DNA-directed RNA polymerase delta subunit
MKKDYIISERQFQTIVENIDSLSVESKKELKNKSAKKQFSKDLQTDPDFIKGKKYTIVGKEFDDV